jgi:hypothetical protein
MKSIHNKIYLGGIVYDMVFGLLAKTAIVSEQRNLKILGLVFSKLFKIILRSELRKKMP